MAPEARRGVCLETEICQREKGYLDVFIFDPVR
jgi:hypothetical protein